MTLLGLVQGFTKARLSKSSMSNESQSHVRITLTKKQLTTYRGRELFNLLSEISADGVLTTSEIEQLRTWLNADTNDKLPAESQLNETLQRLLANGSISQSERIELQKEIERVLPATQRLEAKEARKRVMALMVEVSQESSLEDNESRDVTFPDDAITRQNSKQKANTEALLSAVRAHEKGAPRSGTKNYHITLPDRRPYEPKATMKQKDLLWALGVEDQAILETLGKWQASAMIDQIKSAQEIGCGTYLAALGVLLVIIIFWAWLS